MAKGARYADGQQALTVLTGTFVALVVIAAFYWARAVFIPLALAVFLTFVLSPIVSALQRRGLWRTPAVIVVVTLAALLLGSLGWVVTRQVTSLVTELPNHTQNIKDKIQSLRELTGPAGDHLGTMFDDLTAFFKSPNAPKQAGLGNAEKPVPVVLVPDTPPWLTHIPGFLSPVVEFLGQGALAIVLVVFMLLKREDMRNRFIRLVGRGRMTATTKAVDDAGHRVSRFLLAQAMVNGSYGVALALGLWTLDVRHAVLWGFLAAVLRYIPYIGAWIAALFPVSLSLLASPGWMQPVYVIGLVLVLELLSNNAMEPWLYGQSMGISEVALLVSAAFWAFLWGPIGMVLSAPLTVCLVVLGKYVPNLGFLEVLLGDEPPLDKDVRYYQRLTARDQDEAAEIVLAHHKEAPAEQVYDDLLLPALNYTKRDRDGLDDDDERFIIQATREILEDLGERTTEARDAAAESLETPRLRVLACPARDGLDQVALEMFQQLLNPAQWEVQVLDSATLAGELVALVEDTEPAVVCIGSLPPGGLAHTRYLCKRLRSRFPNLKLVVGRWGLKGNLKDNEDELKAAGADEVGTSLLNTRHLLQTWFPVLSQQPAPAPSSERPELMAAAH